MTHPPTPEEFLKEFKEPRKPPTKMPATPEELYDFLSWPEAYEGESVEELAERAITLNKLKESLVEDQKPRFVKPIKSTPLLDTLFKRAGINGTTKET